MGGKGGMGVGRTGGEGGGGGGTFLRVVGELRIGIEKWDVVG